MIAGTAVEDADARAAALTKVSALLAETEYLAGTSLSVPLCPVYLMEI